jgi:hypothetical protein
MLRERWTPNGQHAFSVEHISPKAVDPSRECEYDNLAYACCSCNSAKQDEICPINLASEAIGYHLEIRADGIADAKTEAGLQLVEICRLNRPTLVEFRRRVMRLHKKLSRNPRKNSVDLVAWFGYPDDLPNLMELRPPEGNFRENGLASSYSILKNSGTLAAVY